MKKRFIPATVAALALTFSAVAVPQAVAQENGPGPVDAAEAAENDFQADMQLKPGGSQEIWYQDLVQLLDFPEGEDAPAFGDVTALDVGLEGVEYAYENDPRIFSVAETVEDGNYEVLVTIATEDDSVSGTLNLTVDGSAPVIAPIEDRTLWKDAAIEPIEVEVGDLTDVAIQVDELPDGLSFNEETREITGTPTEATSSGDPAEVTVTATDELGNESTETFYLTVTIDTTDPVVADIEDQEWEVGTEIEPIEIDVTEANPYTVTVEHLPDGVTFDTETERISGTPTEETQAAVTVTVTATDAAGNEGEDTFNFTVGPDVTDPVITPPANQTVTVGAPIDPIEIVVSEDAEVVVGGLPGGLTHNEEAGTITGTPAEVTDGPVVVTINAEDAAGNEAEEVSFTISVVEADDDGSSIGSAEGSSIEGSSADDINWGLVGLGGVLAAVIGVIAAIGGGFIQLPPAIANLIPFL